jgi:hypothetical protein
MAKSVGMICFVAAALFSGCCSAPVSAVAQVTKAERNADVVDHDAPTMPPPEYDHPFRGQLHVLSGTQEEIRLFCNYMWPSFGTGSSTLITR